MKLIHGDSHVELEKIKSESIDAIIIDPPYRYFKKEKKFRLDKSFDREKIFNELQRVLKKKILHLHFWKRRRTLQRCNLFAEIRI